MRHIRRMESGLSNVPDKSICVKHIPEPYIQSFIRKNYNHGYCSYCNKPLKVIKLQELLELYDELYKEDNMMTLENSGVMMGAKVVI